MNEVQRKPCTSSKSLLIKSQKMSCIPSAMMCDIKILSTREACPTLGKPGVQGFYWVQSWRHSLPSMYQNSRFPEGRQVFQHKSYCLYKAFRRHNKPLLSVREWEGRDTPKLQTATLLATGELCR